MPVADDRARLAPWLRSTDANQHNGCDCDRSRGVHGDAKRAMIGGLFGRMKVRYLNDRKESEKDKAEDSHQRRNAGNCAAFPAELWRESCQSADPYPQEYIRLDAASPEMVVSESCFSARAGQRTMRRVV
jgi:hypothetical protein